MVLRTRSVRPTGPFIFSMSHVLIDTFRWALAAEEIKSETDTATCDRFEETSSKQID